MVLCLSYDGADGVELLECAFFMLRVSGWDRYGPTNIVAL